MAVNRPALFRTPVGGADRRGRRPVRRPSAIATKTTQVQEEDGFRDLILETEASLAVGAPGEDVGARANAGAVTILPATAECSDMCDYYVEDGRTITQGSGGVSERRAQETRSERPSANSPASNWGW